MAAEVSSIKDLTKSLKTYMDSDQDKSTVRVFRDTLKIFKEMLYFKFKN